MRARLVRALYQPIPLTPETCQRVFELSLITFEPFELVYELFYTCARCARLFEHDSKHVKSLVEFSRNVRQIEYLVIRPLEFTVHVLVLAERAYDGFCFDDYVRIRH